MTSVLAETAGELSLLGCGRPTDLLKLKFNDPAEQLRWDNAIMTRSLEVLKAQSEGKSGTDEDRKRKMRELTKDSKRKIKNGRGTSSSSSS